MPPPVQPVTNDVEGRLRAAVVEARLRKALENTKGAQQQALPPQSIHKQLGYEDNKFRPEPTDASKVLKLGETMGKPYRPGREVAFFGNAANAITFGQLDKIGALPALWPGGETYDEARERARNNLSMAREDYPVTSLGGDVAGFIGPGGVIAKTVGAVARPAVNFLQRANPLLGAFGKITSAAAQGATGAAAYGATVGAENQAADQGRLDPTLEERGQLAKDYAPVGAAAGGAFQAAAPALRPIGRAAGGAVAYVGEKLGLTPGSIGRNAAKVGRDAALRSLERAGIVTVDDFLKRAAKYGDKPVVTGELGQDPLNSLVSLVRSKGTTGEKAGAILEGRVAGLPGRLLKDLADETGISPEDIYGSIDDLVKSSRAAAAPKYEAAEAAPFAETANLERIVRDAPILRSLFPKAQGRVQNQAVPQIGQGDQMPPLKAYDELKQLVDEEINRRLAKGEGIEDIEGVRKALVEELDLISGQAATGLDAPPAGSSLYGAAREAGGDAPRIQSAFKSGEAMMGGRYNAPQVEREIAQLTGAPLTAAQKGVVQNIVTQVERGNLTPKRVKTVEFRKKLESVFGKPAADGIIRKFGVEAELQKKGSRWDPNINTTTPQALLGQPSAAGDAMMRTGVNAARGNWLSIAADGINGLRRQGYSEPQLNALGDIFLSSPDDAAKTLYPGKSPKPGSVPPTIPPAGQRRTNPPPQPSGPPKLSVVPSEPKPSTPLGPAPNQKRFDAAKKRQTEASQRGDLDAYVEATQTMWPNVMQPGAVKMAIGEIINAGQAAKLIARAPESAQAELRQLLDRGHLHTLQTKLQDAFDKPSTPLVGGGDNLSGLERLKRGLPMTPDDAKDFRVVLQGHEKMSPNELKKLLKLKDNTPDNIVREIADQTYREAKQELLTRVRAQAAENNRQTGDEITRMRERGVDDRIIARNVGLEDDALDKFASHKPPPLTGGEGRSTTPTTKMQKGPPQSGPSLYGGVPARTPEFDGPRVMRELIGEPSKYMPWRGNPRFKELSEKAGEVIGEVPVGGLKTTQSQLRHNFKDVPKNYGSGDADLPQVVRENGVYYIRDGNHRIAAQISDGAQTIRARIIDLDSPPTGGEGSGPPAATQKGPPRNALRDEAPRPKGRIRLNTRADLRDAPPEYRAAVMKAPEGIAQSIWDSVRKSTGNRLPSPNALQYRVREIELKGNPTAAELRELKALREMKRRLEDLPIKYE